MSESPELHISSLVVRCLPEALQQAMADTTSMPGAEVHQHDPEGKFIVTLETGDESGIVDAIREIENMRGVVNTSLVYHQVEDAP